MRGTPRLNMGFGLFSTDAWVARWAVGSAQRLGVGTLTREVWPGDALVHDGAQEGREAPGRGGGRSRVWVLVSEVWV
jgi:hypothetical protein